MWRTNCTPKANDGNRIPGTRFSVLLTPKLIEVFRPSVFTSFFYSMVFSIVFVSNSVRIYCQNFFRKTSIKISTGESFGFLVFCSTKKQAGIKKISAIGHRKQTGSFFCSPYLGVNILLMRMKFGVDDYGFASSKLSAQNERITKAAISLFLFFLSSKDFIVWGVVFVIKTLHHVNGWSCESVIYIWEQRNGRRAVPLWLCVRRLW